MGKATDSGRDRATEIIERQIELPQEREGREIKGERAGESIVLEVEACEEGAIGKVKGQGTRESIGTQAEGIKGIKEAKSRGRERANQSFSREAQGGDTKGGRDVRA